MPKPLQMRMPTPTPMSLPLQMQMNFAWIRVTLVAAWARWLASLPSGAGHRHPLAA